jgi:hypothetical protein
LRDEALEQEREDKTRIIESSDARLHEIERRALSATDRVAAAEQQHREALAARETELTGQKAEVEAELAAARRQLEESDARAAELERRALAAEQQARQSADRDREDEAEPEPEPASGQTASFEELAEEAERLGGAAPASEPAADLEPPDWVVEEEPPEVAAEPEREEEKEPEPEEEEPEPGPEPEPEPVASTPPEEVPDGAYSLATVDFDELRGLGMSVTQAKRVLRYRVERGGFASIDELDAVPGFPKGFLSEVKDRLVP